MLEGVGSARAEPRSVMSSQGERVLQVKTLYCLLNKDKCIKKEGRREEKRGRKKMKKGGSVEVGVGKGLHKRPQRILEHRRDHNFPQNEP